MKDVVVLFMGVCGSGKSTACWRTFEMVQRELGVTSSLHCPRDIVPHQEGTSSSRGERSHEGDEACCHNDEEDMLVRMDGGRSFHGGGNAGETNRTMSVAMMDGDVLLPGNGSDPLEEGERVRGKEEEDEVPFWGRCFFIEGDDWHSAGNKEKMARGQPLTDEDRADWLEALGREARRCLEMANDGSDRGPSLVLLTCSALKASYRAVLRSAIVGDDDDGPCAILNSSPSSSSPSSSSPPSSCSSPPSSLSHQLAHLSKVEGATMMVVWLRCDGAVLADRLHNRAGHFFPPSLLASQLATLEAPSASLYDIDGAVWVDVNSTDPTAVAELTLCHAKAIAKSN